jgi:hypothetical protein
MKRHFVIEVDDDFVRVLEVRQEFTGERGDRGVAYHRAADAGCLVNSFDPDAKFFGQLNALLVTKSRIQKAAPIEPEPFKGELISGLTQTVAGAEKRAGLDMVPDPDYTIEDKVWDEAVND